MFKFNSFFSPLIALGFYALTYYYVFEYTSIIENSNFEDDDDVGYAIGAITFMFAGIYTGVAFWRFYGKKYELLESIISSLIIIAIFGLMILFGF